MKCFFVNALDYIKVPHRFTYQVTKISSVIMKLETSGRNAQCACLDAKSALWSRMAEGAS